MQLYPSPPIFGLLLYLLRLYLLQTQELSVVIIPLHSFGSFEEPETVKGGREAGGEGEGRKGNQEKGLFSP